MSWLYTILFTGLALSSQEGSANKSQVVPVVDNTAVHSTFGDETEKFEQTYPLNANGRVNVSNVNGSVVVEAWDRSEVKLSYTKVADSKDRLADVEVKVDSRADYFSVETDYNNWKKDKGSDAWRSGRLNVEIKMMVPRGAVLNEIETVNGSVSVSNFTNITRVSAVNGSVRAINIRGTAKLSTVNGEVAADFDRLEAGTKISLDTVNGKVNLVIPSDSNATVRADSLNGSITNDFGLPVRKGKYIGRDLYGKLGSGEVQIKLDSVNGNLSVARKADGKTLSPAVNLLPQKEKDDDNWDRNDDNDNESMKSSKLDKDIAKAVKESQKASAKAVVDAQAAISKIQPEIAKITAESISRSAEAIARSAEILSSRDLQRELERAQVVQRNAINGLDINFSGTPRRVEKKSGVFVMKGVPTVTIYAEPCNVKVTGWDKDEVQYRVVQYVEARRSDPLKVTDEHSDSTVKITVDEPKKNNGQRYYGDGTNTRIEVFVPRRSNLKITANGELRVDGVSGNLELMGADEPINIRDSEGKLNVKNLDGQVRVIGFNGEVDSRTGDGDIYLEGQFSRINGNANDGSFFLTVPENPNVDIKANIEALTIENLRIPTSVSEGHWRFGAGGPKYTFTVSDGCVTVRNATSLSQ